MKLSKTLFIIFENAFSLTNISSHLHDNDLLQKPLTKIKRIHVFGNENRKCHHTITK